MMTWQFNLYTLLLFISAGVSFSVALFAWRRRPTSGAIPLTLLMLAVAEWALGYGIAMGSDRLPFRIFWAKMQYLGIASVGALLLILVLDYTGNRRWLTRRNLLLLSLEPLIRVSLAFTNESHGWIWRHISIVDQGAYATLDIVYGPAFWIGAALSYVQLLIATLLLVRTWLNSRRVQRFQVTMMLVGVALPWLGNLSYLLHLNPLPYIDWTPFLYSLAGVAVAWALFRYRLLDIVPIAREAVIEGMPDGVMILDAKTRVVDLNPAAQQMFDCTLMKVLGLPWDSVEAFGGAFSECVFPPPEAAHFETTRVYRGRTLYYDVRISALDCDGQEAVCGWVVVLRDVTEQRGVELDLQTHRLQLEAQNAQLHKLTQAVEQSANTIVITDREGLIEYVNPKFVEMTGYAVSEVLAKRMDIVKSGHQSEAFYRDLWDTIESGQAWHGELLNRRKDGTLFWEEVAISPVRDDRGEITHFIGVKVEVTERKQAEQALHTYTERLKVLHEIDQSILAARAPETIALEAAVRVRRLIPCERILILEISVMGEMDILAIETHQQFPPAQKPKLYGSVLLDAGILSGHVQGVADLLKVLNPSLLERQLLAEGVRSYTIVPLMVETELVGTLHLESISPNAFDEDHVAIATEVATPLALAIRQSRLFTLAQQEIAERQLAEAALLKYTQDLEASHAELDAFAHTVAHDLKNPLTSLIGASEALLSLRDELSASQSEGYLRLIQRSAWKMTTITDSLLLMASVRKMEQVPVTCLEMEAIVDIAIDRLRGLLDDYQAEVAKTATWPQAMGYAPWVEEVWVNYISNAIKYGGRPPCIALGADRSETEVRYWVQDNGIGIAPNAQAQLFTEFTRLRQRSIGGHGLGLSIVERIIRRLGGQVGVESHVGKGSRFFFTLPAPQGATAAMVEMPFSNVVWEREKPQQEPASRLLSEDYLKGFAALPQELLRDLESAVTVAEIDWITRVIGEIDRRDTLIGALLRRLAEDFQHEAILELLQDVQSHGVFESPVAPRGNPQGVAGSS
ncbi:MAG: PAS domain S-box protein [Anaerolineae bacterium]|nr:PAS domain S-box protein [Anaerolineae bacterium]